MIHRLLIPLTVLTFSPAAPLLAASQSLEQEYDQVRTIALRDPKVRAAYDDADRKLQAKIVQIDPALASYHRGHPSQNPTIPSKHKTAELHRFRPEPSRKSAAILPDAPSPRTHTVLQGETLSSIATIYGVTAGGLKSANHITNDRKLRVGQTLTVPPRLR